jgi:hypothetical protein
VFIEGGGGRTRLEGALLELEGAVIEVWAEDLRVVDAAVADDVGTGTAVPLRELRGGAFFSFSDGRSPGRIVGVLKTDFGAGSGWRSGWKWSEDGMCSCEG